MKIKVKFAAVATGLAMATSMLSLAPMAHAASLTTDQINSVVNMVAAFGADAATVANVRASLTGGTPTPTPGGTTGGACAVPTVDLKLGSTGAQVIGLQTGLVAGGYLVMPAGVAMGNFGPATQAAVIAWQKAAGISPAAGYFGPISRAAFNLCGTTPPTPPGTPPPGTLSGTDGSISDVTELGSFNNEEVGEGQDDVKVLGADVEASNDGDIALKSIKVSFDSTGNTGSDNLDDYISGVSVWLGSEKIGTADVEDFSESAGVFTKTISLSGKTTILAEKVGKLYIAVDGANTFDSSDIGAADSWTVDIENIRFVDGSGVYTTETGYEIDGMDVAIDFVSFSSASDTELKISTSSDTPAEGIVIVDESSTTENVSMLKGKLKLEGTSDAVLDEFPVTLTVTGATDVDMVTTQVTLKIGGEEYTETVTTSTVLTATVTFDNLDFAMEAGKTVDFEVLAEIEDTDGDLDAGDSLTVTVSSTNRDYIDIENEEGDQLSDSTEKSGTANGKTQQFFVSGVGLALVSTTAVSDNDDAAETGTFTIKFKVTAFGDTIYVSSVVADATNETVDVGGTTTTAGSISRTLVNNTDTDKTSVGNYQIDEGTSETFSFTVTVPNGAGGTTGQYRAALTGFLWDTSDDVSPANTYTSGLDEFVTSYVQLSNS